MRCESCQERKTGSWSWSDRIVRRLRSIRSCRSWLAFGILYRKNPANPLPDGTSLVSKHHFARGFFASQEASPETSADVNLRPKSGCARRGVGATLPPPARLQGSGGASAVLASSLQPAAVQLWLYPRACVHYGELLGGPAHRPRCGLGKDKSKLGSVLELMSKITQLGGN